jgi:DNA polymerase (family X)
VTDIDRLHFREWLENKGFIVEAREKLLSVTDSNGLKSIFHVSSLQNFGNTLFETTGPESFTTHFKQVLFSGDQFENEEALFKAFGIEPVPPFLRDLWLPGGNMPENLITQEDIKGIIHSHSQWSDGTHTLKEMALAARQAGMEYLVISDHSKIAFYANGLSEERIEAQHKEIDHLNKELAPFRIFKSIEADILSDGSLDYREEILATFDLVIASVHSNLKMSEEKANARLIKAIENPYTRILGHMTGRLLLSRNGYPVDHEKIIDACAANQVVIELNAHPRRLDMDWRWIRKALDKGVLISIDPDAHSIEGYNDVKYGVLAAQKAGVKPKENLSSFTLSEFQDFLLRKR